MKQLTVSMTDEMAEILKDLREKSGSADDLTVIRKALGYYQFLIKNRNDENIVLIITPTEDVELRIE
jgi:hypothetical protein